MLCDVSEDLHAFFVPQMQQLGLQEHPARFGSLSSVSAEWGEGPALGAQHHGQMPVHISRPSPQRGHPAYRNPP